jgi:predicted DNA-binding protein
MLAINLEPELEKQIVELAERNGYSLDAFVQEAIARLVEDMGDAAKAEEILREYDPSTNVSLEDVKRRLGLEG